MAAKKFHVYVIRSKEGYKYTGCTADLELRLKQHNDKSLSFWTKRGTDWDLIFTEEFLDKSEALKKEKWLKMGAGRDFINKLI
jgi:putative endonuclease